MPLQLGQTLLNKYQIERLIGEGGFGYVYQATDLLLQRRVAIKELKPEIRSDGEALRRFVREAQAAGASNHPNIVTIHALELTDNGAFIVMEYMDGGSLADRLRARRTFSPNESIQIILPILDALASVHARGIIHRDIKPPNILFTHDGRVKLSDFGLARRFEEQGQSITQAGMVLGTIRYMSPEQARGERADARSDLYAVGAVLYEMLGGRPYLDFTSDVLQNLEKIKAQTPIPLSRTIPRDLANVVMRALSKSRQTRFASAQEMKHALAARDDATVISTTRPAKDIPNNARAVLPPRSTPPVATLIVISIVALVLLLIAGFVLLGGNNSQNRANQLAQSQTSTAIYIALANTLTPLAASPTRPLPTSITFSIPTSQATETFTTEPSATFTLEPSPTNTEIPPTDTPTNLPSSTPTATHMPVVPTRTRTATPTAVVPPQPSQPPSGLVHYSIPSNNKGIDELLRLFKLITRNADLNANRDSFFAAHPEIHCAGDPSNAGCSRGTFLIHSDELQPFGFEELRSDNVKFGWLRMQIDDRVRRGKNDDLEQLANCCWGQWVLVRGTWQVGSFKIEPDDFIFVWDAAMNGYFQRNINCINGVCDEQQSN